MAINYPALVKAKVAFAKWTFVIVILLLMVALVNVLLMRKPEPQQPPCHSDDTDFIPANSERVNRFSESLRLKTLSFKPHVYDNETILQFHKFLKSSFPTIHSSQVVVYETVNEYSLLYTVSGGDKSLRPYILAAHIDVVPADAESWSVDDPFSGELKEENGTTFIYGRGAMDDKGSLMAIFEALEFRLTKGDPPERTIYIAIGHDEEVGGDDGARAIGKLLSERRVKPLFLLDEGTVVNSGVFPGIQNPVIEISIGEKGWLDLELSTSCLGGHSSMPPDETCIGILAKAVSNLETHQMPAFFGKDDVTYQVLEKLAPYSTFAYKFILGNLWLFRPLVKLFLMRDTTMAANLRTTTAVTIFNSGVKSNVLPRKASATVNFRIHPKQSILDVLNHVDRVIHDSRVGVKTLFPSDEPSITSPFEREGEGGGEGIEIIETSAKQIFPDGIVVPGILVGGTDCKHYYHLTNQVYRFNPTVFLPTDFARYHGIDERISIKSYEQHLNFFYHLMKNADNFEKRKLEKKHDPSEL